MGDKKTTTEIVENENAHDSWQHPHPRDTHTQIFTQVD